MSSDTFTNALVKKFLGKEFIPRFARYLIIFPDYKCSLLDKLADIHRRAITFDQRMDQSPNYLTIKSNASVL